MKYRQDIKYAYDEYLKLKPLDVKNDFEFLRWKNLYSLDILKYSRIVSEIRKLNNINEIIKSDFDFDNYFIILESLINSNFLYIKNNGNFIWNWLEVNNFNWKIFYGNIFENPNFEFNQFPCNIESKIKRVKLFYERFPYVEKMYIWIFWDDDLLSLELFNTWIYIPIVYEIDEKIISIIEKKSNYSIKIIIWDILNKEKIDYEVDTFISDPPYNINWLINFIEFWIKNLNKNTNEFFIIFNKMMLWNYYSDLLNYLINHYSVYLINKIENFSIYNFPNNYRELIDLNKKLEKLSLKFSEKNISSSSSLFEFKILDLQNENYTDLIYKRY